MQDRFKFRAWDKEESKYINDIQECEGGTGSYEPCQMCFGDYFLEYYKCENYIVEQCTGLKDKNGKLIYEGDVVDVIPPDEWSVFDKYNHSEGLGKKAVVEDHGAFLLNNNDVEDSYLLYWAIKNASVKIIGNVHENPELLEEG